MPDGARRAPALDAALDLIDAEVARRRSDGSIPGLALAVTDRDRLLIDRVYGDAEVASGRPVDHDTLFEIGSIGKTVTAVVVMQLVAEGRLGLDDPVVRHLAWFHVPRTGPRITIRHLLNHTAGITAGIDGTPEAAFQVWRLRDMRPGSGPGRRTHYSNVGYKALGIVLEAIEGAPHPQIIRRRVLDPLGMAASEPEITHAIRPHLAVGYEPARDDRHWYEGAPLLPATWLETGTADGSIASTGADMAAFLRMILRGGDAPGGRLVSADAVELMAAPGVARAAHRHGDGPGLGLGHGLITIRHQGRRYVGHTGGMVGYIAGMWCEPETGLGAVVLQNGPGHSPFALARLAIRAVAAVRDGLDPRADRPAGHAEADPGPDATLDGAYRGADGRTFRARVASGSLVLDDAGRSVALEDRGDGRFLVRDPAWDRALLSFDAGGGGAWHGGDRFIRDGAGTEEPAMAAEPATLAIAEPATLAIAGHYRSHDPWTTNFRVVIRGDVPWLCFTAAPDGFDDEAPLRPIGRERFRVGDDPLGPEHVRFDTVIDGHARRAWLSGWDYYRVGDP